jgi:hypothetical protein
VQLIFVVRDGVTNRPIGKLLAGLLHHNGVAQVTAPSHCRSQLLCLGLGSQTPSKRYFGQQIHSSSIVSVPYSKVPFFAGMPHFF